MRKMAIITLCFDNYGTRLQSYALCKVLNDILGGKVSVEVVQTQSYWKSTLNGVGLIKLITDTLASYGLWGCWAQFLRMIRWRVENRLMESPENKEELLEKRTRSFERIKSVIPYTKMVYSYDDIRSGKLEKYDYYLVGSDQVWNYRKVANQDIYMLEFVNNAVCLTYAASFGVTRIPKDSISMYRNIDHFSSLLVREDEAVRICNMLGRTDAKTVLDPTLLLMADDYASVYEDNPLVEGKYILVYSLNQSIKMFDEVNKTCIKSGMRMVVLKRSFVAPSIKKYNNAIELFDVSPGGFLWLIKNAVCVVTNSYHALIFSIIYNKPFYLFLNKSDEENSRLLTIIDTLNLSDRVYWESNSIPRTVSPVCYSFANEVLAKERSRSIELLRDSLLKNNVI